MSTLSVRLPESLHKGLRQTVQEEGISMNQFIVTAVAEKLAALQTESYLQQRATRASRDKYEAALAQVPDGEPEAYDRWPESYPA